MKKFKKIMLVGMMALVLIGFQATSHALTLSFYNQTDVIYMSLIDNAPGDLNPLLGAVTYAGILGGFDGNWALNLTMGLSNRIDSPANPEIDFYSISFTSRRGGQLKFGVVDSGFTGPVDGSFVGPYTLSVDGATDGSVRFTVFGDDLNRENFASTGNFSTDVFSTGAFSESTSGSFAASDLFSLGVIANVTHAGAGVTYFQGNLAAVPEPTSLILFGTGLVALVGFRKLFRK